MKYPIPMEVLKEAFGSPLDLAERPGRSLLPVKMDFDSFTGCMKRWASLPSERRPVLKGVATSPADDSRVFLNFLLEIGVEYPVICLEIEFSRDKALPGLAAVWPYSSWWQEELVAFSDLRFEERSIPEGVSWRLA